jgi:hypothetical protein
MGKQKMPPATRRNCLIGRRGRRMNFPKTGSVDMSPHIRVVEIGSPLSRASD